MQRQVSSTSSTQIHDILFNWKSRFSVCFVFLGKQKCSSTTSKNHSFVLMCFSWNMKWFTAFWLNIDGAQFISHLYFYLFQKKKTIEKIDNVELKERDNELCKRIERERSENEPYWSLVYIHFVNRSIILNPHNLLRLIPFYLFYIFLGPNEYKLYIAYQYVLCIENYEMKSRCDDQ